MWLSKGYELVGFTGFSLSRCRHLQSQAVGGHFYFGLMLRFGFRLVYLVLLMLAFWMCCLLGRYGVTDVIDGCFGTCFCTLLTPTVPSFLMLITKKKDPWYSHASVIEALQMNQSRCCHSVKQICNLQINIGLSKAVLGFLYLPEYANSFIVCYFDKIT